MAGRSMGELGAIPVSPRAAPAAGPGKRGGAGAADYGWQASPSAATVTVVPRVPFLPALVPFLPALVPGARSSWSADDPDGIFSRKPESPIFGRKGHTHPARPAGGVRLDQRFDSPASPIAINNASTPGAGAVSPPPGAAPVRQHLAPSPRLQKYKLRAPCDVADAARLAGYVLGDVLATGGFSTVRRGRSANDDQEVRRVGTRWAGGAGGNTKGGWGGWGGWGHVGRVGTRRAGPEDFFAQSSISTPPFLRL